MQVTRINIGFSNQNETLTDRSEIYTNQNEIFTDRNEMRTYQNETFIDRNEICTDQKEKKKMSKFILNFFQISKYN